MVGARRLLLLGAAAVGSRSARSSTFQTLVFNALRLNKPEVGDILSNDEIRFLGYCLARREKARSQIMQDLWVCFELGEKTNGYFVEFGSTNGVKNSNTWVLEKELGWKGILAEPNPVWHHDLAANRDVFIEHRCVSSRTGETVTFVTTDDTDPELSGIASFSEHDHFAETRSRGNRIEVETISLDDLLAKYDAPLAIDYMSVDTEGSELDILSAFSFRHRFKTISVEHNPQTEDAIDRLLASKGYVRVFRAFSQWDSWYVASELRDGKNRTIVAPDA